MNPRLEYELNPPRILDSSGRALEDREGPLQELHRRIKTLWGLVGGVELTDSALGVPRQNSVWTAGRVRGVLDGPMKITCNIRACDHNVNSIVQLIDEASYARVDGVLILRGDEPRFGPAVASGPPAKIISLLREIGVGRGIKFYLATSIPPDRANLEEKLNAEPDGFITQPIPRLDMVREIRDIIGDDMRLVVSFLVPSSKNARASEILKFDWSGYYENPVPFVRNLLEEADAVLLSSPNHFEAGVELAKVI